MIPIHYLEPALEEFMNDYAPSVENTTILNLEYDETFTFKLSQEN
jgi:hypothetical protein